jgi:hypothetical protein
VHCPWEVQEHGNPEPDVRNSYSQDYEVLGWSLSAASHCGEELMNVGGPALAARQAQSS